MIRNEIENMPRLEQEWSEENVWFNLNFKGGRGR
jgi:hypothetical protein